MSEWLSISDIVTLMEAFDKNSMGTLKLKNGDQSIVLKSRVAEEGPAVLSAACPPQPGPQVVIAQQNNEVSAPAEEEVSGHVVVSPIVGTFYEAPAPDKDPFVRVGQKVKKGDVLFIIESMKLMNEVLSEEDGTVTRICVENAQPVEYGQPILHLE